MPIAQASVGAGCPQEVARCAMVGAGVPGPDLGRPGDEDAPAATTEIDLMTICSGFVRGEMGGTAGGGAAGGRADVP